jgi:hypothetical protein
MLKGSSLLFLGGSFAVLVGCTTLRPSSLYQAVLVRSQPEGATIIVDGEDVGTTPRYVRLRRKRQSMVELRSLYAPPENEFKQAVPLETHYRWRDSFFSDFIFLTATPLAWAIDIGSGTAWTAENSDPIPVRLSPKDLAETRAKAKTKVVAIAPPYAPTLALSDAGAHAIEAALISAAGKNREILAFDDSLPVFLKHGYDYDDSPNASDRRDLYYDLDVDSVFQSTIELDDDRLVLQGSEKNVYTGELSEPPIELVFDPAGQLERVYTTKHWWARLLPNSVGVDFADEKIQATRGSENYKLNPAGGEAWWATSLRYLSAIDITNLPERRGGGRGRWIKSLIPAVHLSRKQLQAGGLPDTGTGTEQSYTRWQLSAGYGGELGYQMSRHYIYLNVIPLFEWNEISWSQSGRDHSITEQIINLSSEVGYIYYFDSNWAVRLFSRQIPEASTSWAEALGSRLPPSPTPLSVITVAAGVSVTYRFEPRFNAQSWKKANQ